MTPARRWIVLVIGRALSEGVEEIDIDRDDTAGRIRFRKDGVLRTALSVGDEERIALVAHLLRRAGIASAAPGRLEGSFEYAPVSPGRVTVLVLPRPGYRKIVIRLPRRADMDVDMDPDDAGRLDALRRSGPGLVIVRGPAGSGHDLFVRHFGQQLGDVHHARSVNDLHGALRSDARVLVVHRRDERVDAHALHASMGGRTVVLSMSQLHAAPTGHLVDHALTGWVERHSAPRICPSCREVYEPGEEERVRLGRMGMATPGRLVLFRGRGCETCANSGTDGRLHVAAAAQHVPGQDTDVTRQEASARLASRLAYRILSGDIPLSGVESRL